jgi:hypothetical protein
MIDAGEDVFLNPFDGGVVVGPFGADGLIEPSEESRYRKSKCRRQAEERRHQDRPFLDRPFPVHGRLR